ncbi:MAG: hypothetical protein MZV63_13715 [Marinilabiliales bacterium]|nr:hypothetical protein [Marinilabiliales bacterium]
MRWFREEVYRTGPVVDRDAYDTWVHRGKKSAWDRACLEVARITSSHTVEPLPDGPAHRPDGRHERRRPAIGHRSASFGLKSKPSGHKDVNMNAPSKNGIGASRRGPAGLRGLRERGHRPGPGRHRTGPRSPRKTSSIPPRGPAERALGLAQRLRRPGSADPRARGAEGQRTGRGHHLGRGQPP